LLMKRCPTCNRTFDEDWLAFCTQDGTTLIVDSPARPDEPPPTILAPPPPPGGWQQSSGGLGSGQFQPQPVPPPVPPSNIGAPLGGFGSGVPQPGGWQPPPPPPYAQGPKQGLAVASMICGIFSITIGWCCYSGVVAAPVAIALGIYQLSQIKSNPDQNTGKPFAIVGIVTGAFYFVLIAFVILIYGVAILSTNFPK
jgi:hypothetical protein